MLRMAVLCIAAKL